MVKQVLFWVLVALILVFVLQNTEIVEVQMLSWKISLSRAFTLLGTFLLGVLAGWLYKASRQKRKKK